MAVICVICAMPFYFIEASAAEKVSIPQRPRVTSKTVGYYAHGASSGLCTSSASNSGLLPTASKNTWGNTSGDGVLGVVKGGGTIVSTGKGFIGVDYTFPATSTPVLVTAEYNGVNYRDNSIATASGNGTQKGTLILGDKYVTVTVEGKYIFDNIDIFTRNKNGGAEIRVPYGGVLVIGKNANITDMSASSAHASTKRPTLNVSNGGCVFLDALGFYDYIGLGTLVISDELLQSGEANADVFAGFGGKIVNSKGEVVIEQKKKTGEVKILFIGNSYTFYNNMPTAIFREIAESAGVNANVEFITKGGCSLLQHADPADSAGKKVDAALKSVKYDYVIVQEQSTMPSDDPASFYDGARKLYEKIKANGAKAVFYGTWGRQTGSSKLKELNLTNESMTYKTASAYTAIGEELGIDVAYVGLAFFDVNTHNKSINLYDSDLTHPSYAGSYLAAMTIFAKMFGKDPVSVEYNGILSPASAAILKTAAGKAARGEYVIPAGYKTSSVGVEPDDEYGSADSSQTKNLTAFPASKRIDKILGTKGVTASKQYSATGLTDFQKADIADIGYGVSVIGAEKTKTAIAVANIANDDWDTAKMANLTFDELKYDINGEAQEDGKYTALITLNLGQTCRIDAFGFYSGSLKGFPGAAETYVSNDGETWSVVPSACWDAVNGKALRSVGKSPADANGKVCSVTCLFDMGGITAQYIRLGIVIGRYDSEPYYNTINTREAVVYGERLAAVVTEPITESATAPITESVTEPATNDVTEFATDPVSDSGGEQPLPSSPEGLENSEKGLGTALIIAAVAVCAVLAAVCAVVVMKRKK